MEPPSLDCLAEVIAYARALEAADLPVYAADWSAVRDAVEREGLDDPDLLGEWLARPLAAKRLLETVTVPYASPALFREWRAADLEGVQRIYLEAVRRLSPETAENAVRAFCTRTQIAPYRTPTPDRAIVVRPVWLHIPTRTVPYSLTLLGTVDDEEHARWEDQRGEARYRAIVQDQVDFIVRYRPDGVRTFVNDAYAEFFGGAPEDFVGTSFMNLIVPEHREPVREKIRRLVEREAEVLSEEHLSVRSDGEERWTHWIDRAIFDVEGNLVELQSVGRDVTEMHEAEQREREVERRLAQARKLEAIGTLAAGLAHDFNNTLTGILAFADGIRRGAEDAALVDECVRGIEDATEQAAELTRSLLELGRRSPRKLEDCDLGRVVDSARRLLSGVLPREVAVRSHLEETPVLRADSGQLIQALVNLGLNARDAIEGPGTIEIRAGVAADEVVLSVVDDGRGMADEVRERIFEPFFTTKGPGEGSGLGLAMVYACATAHGGSVEVESAPGEGATFRVRFPLVRSGTGRAAEGRATGGTETLLLVDDEPMVLLLARQILEEAGYRVCTAVSAGEARVAPDGIDLVVTDHLLGSETGLDVVREWRERRPDLPAVLMTGGLPGRVDPEFDAVVEKPFSAEELLGTVRATLDRRGTR